MSRFAVAAVGADQPGIVAAVTKVFVDEGCNLQDTAMTILGGHFAMMMVVDAPAQSSVATLEAALSVPADRLNLVLMVRPMVDVPTTAAAAQAEAEAVAQHERCTVSVYGADHPGIVHGVADLLAGAGVNIVDLTTRVVGSPDQPVYAMVLEVDVPDGAAVRQLSDDLDGLALRMGVSASVHPSEADIL